MRASARVCVCVWLRGCVGGCLCKYVHVCFFLRIFLYAINYERERERRGGGGGDR